jgi:hypothetical protein
MTKLGNIELFFRERTPDGRLRYTSRNDAYVLLVPRNEETDPRLTYRIVIELHTEESYTA